MSTRDTHARRKEHPEKGARESKRERLALEDMAEREAGWKSLRDKVDALLRALVGDGQPRATDRVTGKRGRSPLEVTLCADGYDERTGQHSAPKLTRREMLELVGEAALRLDEATRQVGELQQFLPNAAEQVPNRRSPKRRAPVLQVRPSSLTVASVRTGHCAS